MEKLDYHPNLIAGSLRTKKTGTIGLIMSDSSNLFFAFMQTYIEDIFATYGYSIIVSNSHYRLDKEIEILKMLRSKRVDGILIVPENKDSKYMENVNRFGIPVVIIERELPGAKGKVPSRWARLITSLCRSLCIVTRESATPGG